MPRITLDRLSLRQLHRVFTDSITKDHWINLRTVERRPWLRAEQDGLRDLESMVDACDSSAADAVDVEPLAADAIEDAFRDRLATALATLPAARLRTLADQTRAAPLAGGALDLEALDAWFDALIASLRYSDGDGDEGGVPIDGEALLELDEKGRATRRPAPRLPDWARAKAQRSAGKAVSPYRIDATFAVGDWLRHKTFGEGLVLEAAEKIRVLFESGARTLVHRHGAA